MQPSVPAHVITHISDSIATPALKIKLQRKLRTALQVHLPHVLV